MDVYVFDRVYNVKQRPHRIVRSIEMAENYAELSLKQVKVEQELHHDPDQGGIVNAKLIE